MLHYSSLADDQNFKTGPSSVMQAHQRIVSAYAIELILFFTYTLLQVVNSCSTKADDFGWMQKIEIDKKLLRSNEIKLKWDSYSFSSLLMKTRTPLKGF